MKKKNLICFSDKGNVKSWTIWDVSVNFCDMLLSFVFLQFWSACSEQKLLAKQKYIIITLTDVLSKAKLYFSLFFHWEKRKQEKTAEYID